MIKLQIKFLLKYSSDRKLLYKNYEYKIIN